MPALPRYPERLLAIRRVTADKAPGGDLSDRDGTVAARYGSASALT